MVRVTRSGGCGGSDPGDVLQIKEWGYMPGKNTVINNSPTDRIKKAVKRLPLPNKFIICFSQIAEFDPAQPPIPN